ncbi:hypothetical protein SAMN05660742_11032 [Propionispira arboris]|uniref:Uncharacterized protein n=1 Tax=Propionispira arboris TaxID=84035 RepID=A0A1H6ZT92_9FIRM|nr:hypothetical protein [Propionispira arboris]SEJ54807.1 hypothetical protein SAMN05660742_11032 [Propionispira arboris]
MQNEEIYFIQNALIHRIIENIKEETIYNQEIQKILAQAVMRNNHQTIMDRLALMNGLIGQIYENLSLRNYRRVMHLLIILELQKRKLMIVGESLIS